MNHNNKNNLYYAVLDTGFTKLLPQAHQNLIARDYATTFLNGIVGFYWTEDMLTLKSMDLVRKNLTGSFKGCKGLIFFRLWQFCYNGKFNFAVLKEVLNNNLEVHFAREKISIRSLGELEKIRPLITTYYYLAVRDHKRHFCGEIVEEITRIKQNNV